MVAAFRAISSSSDLSAQALNELFSELLVCLPRWNLAQVPPPENHLFIARINLELHLSKGFGGLLPLCFWMPIGRNKRWRWDVILRRPCALCPRSHYRGRFRVN